MKTLNDVTCKRCGVTVSVMWADPQDLVAAHICPDGERSESFTAAERVVSGPGERSKDVEVP